MSALIKILIKDIKLVIFKDTINNIKDFETLTNSLFEKLQKISLKKSSLKLNRSDKFILKFEEGKDDTFIPNEIKEGIFDENTFKFFKEKLESHPKEEKYKFYIEKVDSLPKFIIKTDDIILSESLNKYWDISLKDITSDLNLNKLEESNIKFEKIKEERKKNEEILKKIKHNNIICSNCFKKDFNGKRFICSECDDYNLCQNCEEILLEKEIHHREHVFIQINKKLDEDISKYNIVLGNYQKEFQNVEDMFSLEFVIVNNGENDLKNCYILPIRYGENYLSSDSKIITDSIKKEKICKIDLIIKVPKKSGYFEGYFRMFSPNGLPFGDVIHIFAVNKY